MKIKNMFKSVVCILFVNVAHGMPLEDNFLQWERFCNERIEGDVVLHLATKKYMHGIYVTNVFLPLISNGFNLVNYDAPRQWNQPDIYIQSADYVLKGGDIRFEIGYATSSKKTSDGLLGLMNLTSYYSTRGGKIFRQYVEGPGDICLLDTVADITQPTTVQNVFFCRNNVAVRVRNLHGGDVLEFAKLLDECILASSVEESANNESAIQETMSEVPLIPAIAIETQHLGMENKTIAEQIASLECESIIPPPSASSENEVSETKRSNF